MPWMALLRRSIYCDSRRYNWQAFGAGDEVSSGVTASTCAVWMRAMCAPAARQRQRLVAIDAAHPAQSVASFLIVRGDYWWLGYGWRGCTTNVTARPAVFDVATGTPTGVCVEGPAGVFTREFQRGKATLDCNTYKATLPFPGAP